jgi:hypothetical protein
VNSPRNERRSGEGKGGKPRENDTKLRNSCDMAIPRKKVRIGVFSQYLI